MKLNLTTWLERASEKGTTKRARPEALTECWGLCDQVGELGDFVRFFEVGVFENNNRKFWPWRAWQRKMLREELYSLMSVLD